MSTNVPERNRRTTAEEYAQLMRAIGQRGSCACPECRKLRAQVTVLLRENLALANDLIKATSSNLGKERT